MDEDEGEDGNTNRSRGGGWRGQSGRRGGWKGGGGGWRGGRNYNNNIRKKKLIISVLPETNVHVDFV